MKKFSIKTTKKEQLIDITDQIRNYVRELKLESGVLTIFTPHTTSGITINENADPDVTSDLINGLNAFVPLDGHRHVEGNSPAHIKSSVIGCSENIMISGGNLLLGTWQGIYFCEFDGPRTRYIFVGQ